MKITNISNIKNIIRSLKSGDYLFLDIDKTLIFTDLTNKYENPTICTEDDLAEAMEYARSLSNIHIIGLTARKTIYQDATKKQLEAHNIVLDDIIHAPTTTKQKRKRKIITKGAALLKYLHDKQLAPKNIIIIDDLLTNIKNIYYYLNQKKPEMQLTLYQYKAKQRLLNADNDVDFPEDLDDIKNIKSLGGGTHSTYLITLNNNKEYVLKYGVHLQALQAEILCNSIYQIFGLPIPKFDVYTELPKKIALKLQRSHSFGIYQVSEYFDDLLPITQNEIINQMRHFIAVIVFLTGNIDLHINNFIYPKEKNVLLIDAGSNIFFHALGVKQDDNLDEVRFTHYPVIQNTTLASWLSAITENEFRQQVMEIVDKKEKIETVIRAVSNAIRIDTKLQQTILDAFSDRLDKLTCYYHPEKQLYTKFDKKAAAGETAAGTLIYTKDLKVLLAKRTRHNWYGNFGGKSDVADTYVWQTAARETHEESAKRISPTLAELFNAPSHDLISAGNGFIYRLYLIQHDYVDPAQLTDAEHTDYTWVDLKDILESIEKNEAILEENQKTIKVREMLIYPPLYHILKQKSVLNNLQRLLNNQSIIIKRTQSTIEANVDGLLLSMQRSLKPIRSSYELKCYISQDLLNHAAMLSELKNKTRHCSSTIQPNYIDDFSLSDTYLKIFLGNNYVTHDLATNIHSMLKLSKRDCYYLNEEQLKRFTDFCSSLIINERKHPDRIFLYHGTNSSIAFVYMFFSLFYGILQGCDYWPVFRANYTDFVHLAKEASADNNLHAKHAVFSNLFLFGNHDNHFSYSIHYLFSNTTMKSVDVKILIQSIFEHHTIQDQLLDKLLNLFTEFETVYESVLYQISLPKELANKQVFFSKYYRYENLRDQTETISSLVDYVRKNQKCDIQNKFSYLGSVQLRPVLPPHLKLETKMITRKAILSPLSITEIEKEQLILKNKISEVAKKIVFEFLTNAIIPNTSHFPPQCLLLRILLNIYNSERLAFIKPINLPNQLAEAILDDRFSIVKNLFERNCELKWIVIDTTYHDYYHKKIIQINKLSPIEIILRFKRDCVKYIREYYTLSELENFIISANQMDDNELFTILESWNALKNKILKRRLHDFKDQTIIALFLKCAIEEIDYYTQIIKIRKINVYDLITKHSRLTTTDFQKLIWHTDTPSHYLYQYFFVLKNENAFNCINVLNTVKKYRPGDLYIEFAFLLYENIHNEMDLYAYLDILPPDKRFNFIQLFDFHNIIYFNLLKLATYLKLTYYAFLFNYRNELLNLDLFSSQSPSILNALPAKKIKVFIKNSLNLIKIKSDFTLNVFHLYCDQNKTLIEQILDNKIENINDLSIALRRMPAEYQWKLIDKHADKVKCGKDVVKIIVHVNSDNTLILANKFKNFIDTGLVLERIMLRIAQNDNFNFLLSVMDNITDLYQNDNIIIALENICKNKRAEFLQTQYHNIPSIKVFCKIVKNFFDYDNTYQKYLSFFIEKISCIDDLLIMLGMIPINQRIDLINKFKNLINSARDITNIMLYFKRDTRLDLAHSYKHLIKNKDDLVLLLSLLVKKHRLEFIKHNIELLAYDASLIKILQMLNDNDQIDLVASLMNKLNDGQICKQIINLLPVSDIKNKLMLRYLNIHTNSPVYHYGRFFVSQGYYHKHAPIN